MLFGDGAGAIVLDAQQQSGTMADGGVAHHPTCAPTVGTKPSCTSMEVRPRPRPWGISAWRGREVFKHAVGMITDVIVDAFKATGTTADDITWFVPHQANKRIIDASAHEAALLRRRRWS